MSCTGLPRFFAPDSFWNTPLPAATPPNPDHARFLDLARWSTREPGPHLNLHAWTIPVYPVKHDTPRVPVGRRLATEWQGRAFRANSAPFLHPGHPDGHDPAFSAGPVPLPPEAMPDAQEDAHLALVSAGENRVWEMWAARRRADGAWECCAGMSYPLDGSGVFDPARFAIRNGESIHLHGPTRASGVPAIAGLIRHDDIRAGRIAHKLAFASKVSGLLAHHFPPATWTDGGAPGGLPAGLVFRLDPALDLSRFDLSPAARVVARALQEYGAVQVDYAGGFTLYGEGLWHASGGESWHGLLDERGLVGLGFEHLQFLAPEPLGQTLVEKGMVPLPHWGITGTYRALTGIPERRPADYVEPA
jgi:hypothetical protein